MEQRIQSSNNNNMGLPPIRSDLVGLKSRLASISAERNMLQETLRQIQTRVAQDVESSLLQQSQSYEARLTELHSVIAQLRKQLDVQRAKVIPEESCEESCGEEETQTDDLEVYAPSDADVDEISNETGGEDEDEDGEHEEDEEESMQNRDSIPVSASLPVHSCLTPRPGVGVQYNADMKKTSMKNRQDIILVNDKGIQADEFDCPCRETTSSAALVPIPPTILIKQRNTPSQTGDRDASPNKTTAGEDISTRMKSGIISHSQSPNNTPGSGFGHGAFSGGAVAVTAAMTSPVSPIASLCKEVAQIREEHVAIRHNLLRKEGELEKTRGALGKIAQERDFLQRKVSELEFLLKESPRQFPQFISFSPNSGCGRSPSSPRGPSSDQDSPLQLKMAERVRLRADSASGSPKASPTSPKSPMSLNNNSTNICNNNGIAKKDSSPKYRNHSRNTRHTQQQLISGSHLVSIGSNCKSRIVEQLTSTMQGDSMLQEMENVLSTGQPEVIREKIREYEVETERLTSRLEHYRAQNDVLTLNLAEAKGQANHLATLLGKYESNNVALEMTLGYSDHTIDAYDVLVALLESELGQLLANCRAVGIGSTGSAGSGFGSSSSGIGTLSHCPDSLHYTTSTSFSKDQVPDVKEEQEDEHVKCLLQRANENRFVAENAARTLLNRLVDNGSPGSENNNTGSPTMMTMSIQLPGNSNFQSSPPAWEDTSCGSQTLSSASSLGERSSVRSQFVNASATSPTGFNGNGMIGCSGSNELRIRELIIQLKTDRESVRSTVMDLDSSWSLEPSSPMEKIPPSPCDILEAHKLDLETAVLMQELMAMREDRAELRAQLFHVEKDKDSLELLVQKYEVQEEAYKARINYFKAELDSLQQNKDSTINDNENVNGKDTNANGIDHSLISKQTANGRETVLRNRIQELASSLEKVTQSSSEREKQCTDMINELKRANGILIETLESLKRKYQNRVHKMEEQILAVVERHSIQLKLYKDRVHFLEIEMDGRRN